MTKIRTLSIAFIGAAALLLSGCSGGDGGLYPTQSETTPPSETTEPSSPPAAADPDEDANADAGSNAGSDAANEGEADTNGEANEGGEISDDVEDSVILAVNDLTIMCEDWCVSPEQDQFAAADWDAIDDRASIFQFTVYEGEQLDLTRVTEDSDVWMAWEDVINRLPEGDYIEVKPLVMTADKADCSGTECQAAGESFKTEGVRLLYDVSSGEAVYVGITGTH